MNLHELRTSTTDSLKAARGFVICISVGFCLWAGAVILYFWLK